MNRTIYRIKVLISDFFNKVPAVILIPSILLISFLAAAFLIWAGMKMSPVTTNIEDPYESNGNSNKPAARRNTNNSGFQNQADVDAIINSSPTYSSPDSRNNDNSEINRGGGDSIDGNSDQDQARVQTQAQTQSAENNSSSSGSDVPANANTSYSTSSEDANQVNDTQTSTSSGSNKKPSSNSESSNLGSDNNISDTCTYPEGDAALWWRRSSKKQRNCYIKKNGYPEFVKNDPYFCDYDKNEDCYMK